MIHGLYIHIPFCERRCHYCDFNTYEGMTDLAGGYCVAVEQDLRRCVDGGARAVEGGLRSVYFGGGTPSLLEPGLLLGLLEAARARLGLAPDAEVTLEVNPGTADRVKLEALRQGGFNRVSFGFQAAQDRHLQALGRIHSAAQSDQAWDWARQAGFDNMSLDLMFGLSGQTPEDWRQSLDWALGRRPEHVSFYGLTIEPGTRFHHWRGQGQLPLPDEDSQADFYEQGVAAMEAAGLAQYEISNFARVGREARHNSLYWLNRDTLGLGAGAWSFVDGERSGRIKQPQAYIAAAASGAGLLAERERLEGLRALGEEATLALRMNRGLDDAQWLGRHGRAFGDLFGGLLAPALQAGWLTHTDGRWRLSASGRLLSNQVFERLL